MKDITLQQVHKTRNEMLEAMPKGSVCAELGVFEGDFSSRILHTCSPKRLYLVDLFRGVIESGDENGNRIHCSNMEEMPNILRARFADKPVTVVAADSVSWLMSLDNGTLDWVYIDTSHEYQHTVAELLAAAGSVKQGGFICGHDFHAQIFPGVVQAVNQFCLRFGMQCEVWTGDRLPSFKITNAQREFSDYLKE